MIEFRSIVHFVILHNKPHSCSLVWISVATFGVSESNRRYSLLFWLRMWHKQHDNADMKDLMAIWNLDMKIILKLFRYNHEVLCMINFTINKYGQCKLLACVIGVTSVIWYILILLYWKMECLLRINLDTLQSFALNKG